MKRLLLAGALSIPLAVMGHHGWSEYDTGKPIKLTGKVAASGYEHPHGHIHFDAPGKTWNVILAPPSRMERRGLEKTMLKPGAAVTVEGYANRDKPGEMRAERITVDGKTIELR